MNPKGLIYAMSLPHTVTHLYSADPEFVYRTEFQDFQSRYWWNEDASDLYFMFVTSAIVLLFGFAVMYAAI